MEKSETTYHVYPSKELTNISVEDYANEYFPKLQDHIEYPLVIEDPDNSIVLTSFEFDSLAWQQVLKGEEYFQIEKYDSALKYYENAINISESLYVAYLHAGDCYLFGKGNPSKALNYYQVALKINPNDYRTHYYCGSACYNLGEYEKAKNYYIDALCIKPRHDNILITLESRKSELNIRLHPEKFKPKALAKREGRDVNIYLSSEDGLVWMAYGFAKAIQIGESEQNKDTSMENIWNPLNEVQPISSLIEYYIDLVENEKLNRIDYFERLYSIIENGYLHEFIMYEISSQMYPDIIILMPKKFRERIKEYITKYVVIENDN